jgi:zinc/manganese transport system substrate-binding protein
MAGWQRRAVQPSGRSTGLRAVLVGFVVAALMGCTSAEARTGAGPDGSAATVAVVTSTDVWGDVVAQIGGSRVQVTALVNDPGADPHSFSASGQNQLAVSRAQLVVTNGGGYDDFIDTMISASNPQVHVINAVAESGRKPAADGGLNEHLWYDIPSVGKVAAKVADQLSTVDPAGADVYKANREKFDAALNGISAATAAIKAAHSGVAVAVTEPVPGYLLEAAGLVDSTPHEFSEAIEEGIDVPPAVLANTLDLFRNQQVKALVYNEQTTGPQTDAVRAAAEQNRIPVVAVSETLPAGTDYVAWMTKNVQALAAALG